MSTEAIACVIDALNVLGKPYIATGSIVSSSYSAPRATKDADFVVYMEADDLSRLRTLLQGDFDQEPQMSFETVTGKSQHKFRYRRTPFLVEVFEADFRDPHEQARFDRRQEVTLLGRATYFPTAEDVIVGKLRWYGRIRREKDRLDILAVMRFQWSRLDWPYIERWCDEHGTRELMNQCRADVERQLQGGA